VRCLAWTRFSSLEQGHTHPGAKDDSVKLAANLTMNHKKTHDATALHEYNRNRLVENDNHKKYQIIFV
jgi:hypothetical protein